LQKWGRQTGGLGCCSDRFPRVRAPGGTDTEGKRKERLLQIFGHWCDAVTDLIKATPEDDILRRDIYDRPPIFTWTRGRVVLLGDSAHAMQPNLGQVRRGFAAFCRVFVVAVRPFSGRLARWDGAPLASAVSCAIDCPKVASAVGTCSPEP
jgi:hypothetical protein